MPDRRYAGLRVSGAWDLILTQARRDGVHFTLNSGRRTMREQAQLVREKGVWSPSNPHGAARPSPLAPHIRLGRCDHAIDVDTRDGGETQLQRWLARRGTHPANTVPGEPWHLEVPRRELIALARHIKRKRRAKAKPRPVTSVSAAGLQLVASFEGFRSKPYRDAVGVWTIGYGETRGVGAHTRPWSKSKALRRLRERIDRDYLKPVLDVARTAGLALTQHEADALASFAYNLGLGPFARGRTMGDALRSRDRHKIANAFLPYDKAGSPPRRLAGLTRRRHAERNLFLRR